MKNEQLKISVIICTYNRLNLLMRTIHHIQEQHYSNYEIIIVDDGSNDSTPNIITMISNSNDNITYLRNINNIGPSESRRRGYLQANGDIIIFSDDDDYYIDKMYFNKLCGIFNSDPNIAICCANTEIYNEKSDETLRELIKINDNITTREYLNEFNNLYSKPNSTFSLALRANYLNRINYNELLEFNDTSIYLYSLLGKGNVAVIQDIVGVYNIHENNISKGVSSEFIINNLKSKKNIFEIASKKKLLNNPSIWFFIQNKVTLNYYFSSKIKNPKEDIKILIWIIKNSFMISTFKLPFYTIAKIIRRYF